LKRKNPAARQVLNGISKKLRRFKDEPYAYQMAIFATFKVGEEKGIDIEVV
jgi:hypothetical protein